MNVTRECSSFVVRAVLACLPLVFASCSSSPARLAGSGGAATGSTTSASATATTTTSASGGGGAPVIGGNRPVTVQVPASYDASKPAALLILLHGYGASGELEEAYLGLGPVAAASGYLYAHPDGTQDPGGNQFWNATDACCNFYGSTVDDSSYLASLVAEIKMHWNVDPKRVYFLGHSNGAFMSYRMACDHGDEIAAIVSLEGAMWEDTSKCSHASAVNVLEIHGDADMTIFYDGGTIGAGDGGADSGVPYPSANTSVKDWATFDGCSLTPDTSSPPLDLEMTIPGPETTVASYARGCMPGGSAALWTVHGGGHIPNLGDGFRTDVFAFFAAHPKP